MKLLIHCLSIALLCGGAPAAWSQQASNIRGTVTAFDGKTIAVATHDGQTVEVALPEDVNVSGTKASRWPMPSRAPCSVSRR
ncbi:MAG TPA: hypothetical protein VIV84_00190 [Burkholderiaceae bacterium]